MSHAPYACYQVRVEPAGLAFDAEGALTVLEAAEMGRVELPSSCRNGTCRTCLCQLREGQVSYSVEWPGLSAEEKAQGWILPCVAVAESNLVLEQPAARAT